VATDLRPLWDFDDLDATETRFRARLAVEKTAPARAEVLTQLARSRRSADASAQPTS
jgi:hypothetical protein